MSSKFFPIQFLFFNCFFSCVRFYQTVRFLHPTDIVFILPYILFLHQTMLSLFFSCVRFLHQTNDIFFFYVFVFFMRLLTQCSLYFFSCIHFLYQTDFVFIKPGKSFCFAFCLFSKFHLLGFHHKPHLRKACPISDLFSFLFPSSNASTIAYLLLYIFPSSKPVQSVPIPLGEIPFKSSQFYFNQFHLSYAIENNILEQSLLIPAP